MTAKELKQYQNLKREIVDLNSEIGRLRNYQSMDVVRSSDDEFPYTERTQKIYGNDSSTLELILAKSLQKANLEERVEKIDKFISNIDDVRLQRAIALKYIKGYSWPRVAHAIGGNTSDSIRKSVERFLKNS